MERQGDEQEHGLIAEHLVCSLGVANAKGSTMRDELRDGALS